MSDVCNVCKIIIYSALICVPPVLLLPLLLHPFHHTRDLQMHVRHLNLPRCLSTCRAASLALFGRCQSDRPTPSVRCRYIGGDVKGNTLIALKPLIAPALRGDPPLHNPRQSPPHSAPQSPHTNPPHSPTPPTSPAASASSRRTCPSTRRSARRSGRRGCARGSAAPRARI